MKHLPLLRKTCQISVVCVFCILPFMASFSSIRGSLFSLDFFGIPFADPASTVQVAAQSLKENSFPAREILLGAGSSLFLAFMLGRVFCGWLCPYGLLSEFAGSKKAWKHAVHLKTGLFICALLVALFFAYPAISLLSLPGQLSLAPMLALEGGLAFIGLLFIPLLALVLDRLCKSRFFCASVCPQSLLLGLAASLLPKKAPGLRIDWKRQNCHCKGSVCEKACSLGLSPRKNLKRSQCIMCGDCVAACQHKALAFSFKSQDPSPKAEKPGL